jgi:MscS family membrane protein
MCPMETSWLQDHMPAVLRREFLGAELWSYVGILALVFIGLVVQRIVVYLVGNWVRRLVGFTRFRHLDTALHRADRPIGGLIMAMVFHVAFPELRFPARIDGLAAIAIQALAAYSGVWLAYRLIDVLTDFMRARAELSATRLDDQLVPLVGKSLKVFVSIVGGLFILQNLDVDVGSLLAGLGLGGLAIALAAKDTVANLFGSVMIFIDKPFQIGDTIVLNDMEGTVQEVGFRTSRIRTAYDSEVTLPNALVVSAMIDNHGRRKYRRYKTALGLTYDTPPEKVQAFCEGVRAILAAAPATRKDVYRVEFVSFGTSALEIEVVCFFSVTTTDEEQAARSHVNLEIMRLAAGLGVAFAFPTQTVHVETLAAAGSTRIPSHPAPDRVRLAETIDGFGPGGGQVRSAGVPLSRGWRPQPEPIEIPSDEPGP